MIALYGGKGILPDPFYHFSESIFNRSCHGFLGAELTYLNFLASWVYSLFVLIADSQSTAVRICSSANGLPSDHGQLLVVTHSPFP